MHRVTNEEVLAQQTEYKKNYAPFRPFKMTDARRIAVMKHFSNLVELQNGPDTDDYLVDDTNKVEKYLKKFPAGSDTLLLGVGTGRETLVARDIGLNAIGTTLGSRNIDFGLLYLGLSPAQHKEELNEALPIANSSLDVVAGFQVFEHTIAPVVFLLEMYRILRIGGTLLLEWPPAKDFTYEGNNHHQVCFTPGQAKALFQKGGFENIQLYYDNLTPIPESDYWRGDQDKMLVIEGTKRSPERDFEIRTHNL